MERLEYIDDYFKKVTPPEKESDFEQRLLTDKEFAQDVAFYLNTIETARTCNDENKKSRFKEIYYQNNSLKPVSRVKKLWPYAAMMAAALIALFVGIYLHMQPVGPSKLADAYFKDHLQMLSVQMGDNNDLLQQGRNLYNEGNYPGALKKFEELIQNDPLNSEAMEDAGIIALKVQDYDKAVQYFKQLATVKGLTENPGKFYQALTLMKRNKHGDKEAYTELLNEVIKNNLFGKEDASGFVKKF